MADNTLLHFPMTANELSLLIKDCDLVNPKTVALMLETLVLLIANQEIEIAQLQNRIGLLQQGGPQ